MGKHNKKKRRDPAYLRRESRNLDQRTNGLERPRLLVFGFAMVDANQGQNYTTWETYQLLAKTLSRIQGLCTMTAAQAKQQQIIKEYGPDLPSGSAFKHPQHIPPDIVWASIRIQGKERIIGYLEENFIFQVVFLDMEHEFYPSKKKGT